MSRNSELTSILVNGEAMSGNSMDLEVVIKILYFSIPIIFIVRLYLFEKLLLRFLH